MRPHSAFRHETLGPQPWRWQQTWLWGAAAHLSRGRRSTACSLHGGAGGREDGLISPGAGTGRLPACAVRGGGPGRSIAGRELQVRCLPSTAPWRSRPCLAKKAAAGPRPCPRQQQRASGAAPPEARRGRRCGGRPAVPPGPRRGQGRPAAGPRPAPLRQARLRPASLRAASAGEPRPSRAERSGK